MEAGEEVCQTQVGQAGNGGTGADLRGASGLKLRPRFSVEPPRSLMPPAYLGLGSNEGDRLRHLQAAVERLHRYDGLRVVAASPVYETEAHTLSPEEEPPPFLNAVLRAAVDWEPEALLHAAQAVERAEGRERSSERTWAPRPLDIDLLAVDALTRRTDTLTLPHPRLAERRFVLQPWADLAPNFVVPPPFDQSVQSLFNQCSDTASVRRTDYELDRPAAESPGAGDARE